MITCHGKPVTAADLRYTYATTIAKDYLKRGGHSYRSAADSVGCSFRHLAAVLGGERQSRSLLSRLATISPRDRIPNNSPYRRVA